MISIRKIKNKILNIPGQRFKRKIVVIESDDWGTVRMSSKKAYKSLLKKGYPVDKCPYNSNDCLESNSDLENLFEVLTSVKDAEGNPAVITANNIVANPDFDKIRNSQFAQYFYEPFTETLKRYPNHDRVQDLYRKGIQNNVFIPQFHGREHVNVVRWMQSLRNKDTFTNDAFEFQMFSVCFHPNPYYVNEFMDALDIDKEGDLAFVIQSLVEGLDLFKNLWGYHSASFIAPCYIWSPKIEQTLREKNVMLIQGIINQMMPNITKKFNYNKRYHYTGQRNRLGQFYLIRNCFFEPTINPRFDWVDDCLKRMKVAFDWRKPAIVSSHRLNFIGSLNPGNSCENLKKFSELLKNALRIWPDIIFLSTDQLLPRLINKGKV